MDVATALSFLGALFLLGLLADEIGRRTPAPRVTALIVLGVLAGSSGFGPPLAALEQWYEFGAAAALAMVAFLLGGELEWGRLRRHGAAIFAVSASIVLASAALVAGGLLLIGAPLTVALALAGISAATDPAAVSDVIRQLGAKGRFVDVLLGVVAIDDAWGVIVFSVALAAASAFAAPAAGALPLLEAAAASAWEIGGAVAVGAAIGAPAAYLTGRIRPGEPMLAEGLGVVFLCAGVALSLGVSFLLAGMACGAVVANFAAHHTRPFHEIERVEWPFLVLFFVLAGASLDLSALGAAGFLAAAYCALRLAGRLVGGWIGGAAVGSPLAERRWIGAALTPQAGVAVGMALVAGDRFPAHADAILVVTIASTIVFEIFGPVATAAALRRADGDL